MYVHTHVLQSALYVATYFTKWSLQQSLTIIVQDSDSSCVLHSGSNSFWYLDGDKEGLRPFEYDIIDNGYFNTGCGITLSKQDRKGPRWIVEVFWKGDTYIQVCTEYIHMYTSVHKLHIYVHMYTTVYTQFFNICMHAPSWTCISMHTVHTCVHTVPIHTVPVHTSTYTHSTHVYTYMYVPLAE